MSDAKMAKKYSVLLLVLFCCVGFVSCSPKTPDGPGGSGFPPGWPRALAAAAKRFLSEAGGLEGAQSRLDELEAFRAGGISAAGGAPDGSGFPPGWPRALAAAAERFLSEAGGLQGARSELDELEAFRAGGISVADEGPGGSGFPSRRPRALAAAAEQFLSEAGGLQSARSKLDELEAFRAGDISVAGQGPPGSGFPPRWPRALAAAAEQFLAEAGDLKRAKNKLDELGASRAGDRP